MKNNTFIFKPIFFFFFLFNIFFKNFIIIEYVIAWASNLDIKFYFLFDWISNLFISIVLIISGIVIIYRKDYISNDKNKNCFCIIVLIFVLSIIILILMPNILIIILGWDGLGLVSYCLVIFYQRINSYNSGIITIIRNRIGDVIIIICVIYLFNFGSFDFLSLNKTEKLLGIFIILAGITKRAQIPFSAWLPAAIAAPTPVSSLVHSSTLVTAGVYILIRFNYLFKIEENSIFLLKISLITILISGLNAIFETDFKKIIAFSTLRQLSIIIIIMSISLWELAFFHLIIHAIFKSILFLCAGLIIHFINGNQDIRILRRFFNKRPIVLSCILISLLSLIGFPFIGGFYSKDLILEFFFFKVNNLIYIIIFTVRIIFTFLYCLRLLYYVGLKGILVTNYFSINFSKIIIIPIFSLTLILLISGNFLFWICIINYKIIYIDMISKYLGIFILILRIYISMFILIHKFQYYWNIDFFFKMWFLSSLTRTIFLFNSKTYIKITIIDWKWIEILGPSGVKNELIKFSILRFWFNNVNFNKILILLLVITVLIF